MNILAIMNLLFVWSIKPPDVMIELASNNIKVHYTETESFNVTLIDTGLYTNTAGRLKRIQK